MAQATVGALRVTLGANTAQYEAGMRRAQAQARLTGQSITTSMQRAQVASTRAFRGMGSAVAGLGLGILTAGFASAGTAALDYASQLGETAQQIGVTVEQLQILSRIAIENGASQETLERSLQRLNRTLGEAKAGVESSIRIFTALGFSREQINSWSQAGDAIRPVAERIDQLRDSSARATAEVRLFGRAGQQLDPTLQAIARGYDEAAEEARRMGLITAEQAARADDAKDAIDAFARALQIRLGAALADSVDGIREIISWIERLINRAGWAVGQLQQLRIGMAEAEVRGHNFLETVLVGAGLRNPSAAAGASAAGRQRIAALRAAQNNGGFIGQAFERIAGQVGRGTQRRGTGELDLSPEGRGGGGRGNRDAERLREQALRDEAEHQAALRQFRADLLRAEQEQVTDAGTRAELEKQILDIDREEYLASLQLQVDLRELSEARREQLAAAHLQVDEERRQTLELEQARQIDEENREIDAERRDIAAEALRHEVDMAGTAAEARDAQMRLLDLLYRQERARLEEVLADETSSRAAVEKARLRLADLDNWRAREAAGIQRSTMGPLESFLDQLPTTAAKANEALERLAVEGLQSIEDGILSILDGTKSIAESFRDMASSIISDLLRIQIQRMITIPLANALGGGGMDWLGSLLNFGASAAGGVKTKGFAMGGTIRIGGRGGIDRNLLSLNGMPVARVSQGEDLTISPAGRNGSNVYHINVTAPNTGDPRRDRVTAVQQADLVREAVAKVALMNR